jgi:hypothetical protein
MKIHLTQRVFPWQLRRQVPNTHQLLKVDQLGKRETSIISKQRIWSLQISRISPQISRLDVPRKVMEPQEWLKIRTI